MKKNNENFELMSKNPNNWRGIFYVNSKDPRIIVPKINPSLGYTLNFGHKITYIGLGFIILILIFSQIL